MTGILLLLVEDDPVVLTDLELALGEAGFDVLPSPNGEQALTYITDDAARFRGLITDIDLAKGPDGWELAHRIRELIPTMPVLYVSGASSQDWA